MKGFGKFCNVICVIVLFLLFLAGAVCVVKTKLDEVPSFMNDILDIPKMSLMYKVVLFGSLGAVGFSLFSMLFLRMFGFIRTLLAGGIAGYVYMIMQNNMQSEDSLRAVLDGNMKTELSVNFIIFGAACLAVFIVSLIGTKVVKAKSDIY